MEDKRVILSNGELELKLLLPGSYDRSRYDHSGMVEQVTRKATSRKNMK